MSRYSLVLALALAGCATPKEYYAAEPVPTPAKVSRLQAKLISDLNQAIADNAKAGDRRAPIRLKCWQTLLAMVPQAPDLPGSIQYDVPTAGLFDGIERAGALVEDYEELSDAQIPDEVLMQLELGCGPVALRARTLRDKFTIRFVRAGARIGILLK
jgi:hypothetical protein